MKYTKLILSLIITATIISCNSTKKIANAYKAPKIITATDSVVAKKGKMSKEDIQNWPHMDIFTDSVPGMSLKKAYNFIQNKKSKTVIVGIIDSGIDIEHEDLKNVIWTNKKEIAGNGKDDDRNGYIDDINGWNFLGGEKDKTTPEQLEITRLVKQMSYKYEGKTEDQIDDKEKEKYKKYLEMKEKVSKEKEQSMRQKLFYQSIYNDLKTTNDFLTKELGKENFTLEEIQKYVDNEVVKKSMMYLPKILSDGGTLKEVVKEIEEGVNYFTLKSDFMYNLDFKGRLTKDNPDDFNDKPGYGNSFIMGGGEKELHGTHVAGIVAAERNNGIGMNGVANNVKIMVIRAVPDGDEYDKDVAKAIRYAVDNGAKVINMSFGKGYSPHPNWIYDAMKYAEKHDVLLVKAAGNNSHNMDLQKYLHYPTDSPESGYKEVSNNVITVGAITPYFDERLVSSFSNYGKTRVDIFAPGSDIYSTVPKNNKYKLVQGTSMASPEVAGVASLIRSYYPKLSAKQVKQIIIDSGIEFNGEVIKPGTKDEMILFNDLSRKGRILNAYNALLLADKISKGSK